MRGVVMGRVATGVLLSAALGIAGSVGPAAAATPVAPPPSSEQLVTATNALLRPSDVTGALSRVVGRGDAYRVGSATPPGGQDPTAVCVYGPGYRHIEVPAGGAVGFSAGIGALRQEVWSYPSAADASRAWASLSSRIASRCTGSFMDGRNLTRMSARQIAGVGGNPTGWGVTTRTTYGDRYVVVNLVDDAISLVAVAPDGDSLPTGAASAANALAATVGASWTQRATLPQTQDPTLTKAQTVMLGTADVPAALSVTVPADGGWSSFTSYTPDVDMFGCFGVLESLKATSSFTSSLGGLGDVFPGAGSLTQQVFTYPSTDTAAADWRRLQRALTTCSDQGDGKANTALNLRQHGVSALAFDGVPGRWARQADSYDGQFSVKSYTLYLLLGDAIQAVTYGTGVEDVRPVRLDQLPVNVLAEQLAGRWTQAAATARTLQHAGTLVPAE